MNLCYDFETDGFQETCTRIHCMAAVDVDTGQEWTFVNSMYKAESDGTIEDGIELLKRADRLIGHNIIAFDNVVSERLYGYAAPHDKMYDTYIAAQLAYPDAADRDHRVRKAQALAGKPQYPGNLIGRQSLKAWGYRLGIHKGAYGDNRTDWSVFDMDMLRYCMQDVRVNRALYNHLVSRGTVPDNVRETEQVFAHIMRLQQSNGFTLDVRKCERLVADMQKDKAVLEAKLYDLFPPKTIVYFTPKKQLRKEKTVVFNPGSRKQVAENLIEKYGWKPEKYTDAGAVVMDEKVLTSLPYPEAQQIGRYMLLTKRIGQIAEGEKAWLNVVKKDGRLHGRVINVGTPHGRCSHIDPNMAQIPSVTKEYGKECREVFIPRKGWVLVGCDASGIQLRALAHYLGRFDGGEYIKVVTEGDPHTKNQEAAGLPTRAAAKTFIYAFLFGAGDKKIGMQLGHTDPKKAAKAGREVKARFLKGLPALAALLADLKEAGCNLKGLDGRHVPVSESRKALNYLLTAFEAAVMKLATVLTYTRLAQIGLVFGQDYANVAHVHDEAQFESHPDHADQVGACMQQAIRDAGEILGSRCPLDGEYRIGNNWYETH